MSKRLLNSTALQCALSLLVLLLVQRPAYPAALGSASFLQNTVQVDIPAQGVATAMLELSKQARVQVLMPGGSLDAYQAPALQGQMPLQAALERLLFGTRHRYWVSGERVITVESETPAAKR